MRVIRTEMYFTDVEHEYKVITGDTNVDFAWFKTGETSYPIDEFVVPIISNANNQVARFLDIIVQGVETRQFESRIANGRIVNRRIVDFLFESEIVIERSPPDAVPFSSLLRKASSVTIGTFLGAMAVGENYPLMFITVPLGIIVVGSAMGVSKGLEKGLAKRIEKLTKL